MFSFLIRSKCCQNSRLFPETEKFDVFNVENETFRSRARREGRMFGSPGVSGLD